MVALRLVKGAVACLALGMIVALGEGAAGRKEGVGRDVSRLAVSVGFALLVCAGVAWVWDL